MMKDNLLDCFLVGNFPFCFLTCVAVGALQKAGVAVTGQLRRGLFIDAAADGAVWLT